MARNRGVKRVVYAAAVATLKDPHAMLAPIRNDEGVKFPVFLVCIHSVEITEI